MKFLVQSLFLILCTKCLLADPLWIKPDNSYLAYEGRIDFQDRLRPCFMYSGVSVGIAFKGTSVRVIMKNDSDHNFFAVDIDGKITVKHFFQKDSVYRLADGLENTWHRLTIIRRTEWHGGNSRFLGFLVDQGTILRKINSNPLQFLFVGNSLTCGYGIQGASIQEHFKYETENVCLTYAFLTAKHYNAGYRSVCLSGIGIYSGRGDTTFSMNKLFDQVCQGCAVKGDEPSYQPDLVVVELGINDFAADLDTVKFRQTYSGFVNRLLSVYPKAKIICMVGPYPGLNNKKYPLLETAIELSLPVSPRINLFPCGTIMPEGSDWHPSARQHLALGNQLVRFIKKKHII